MSIWLVSHSGLLMRSSTSVAGRSRVADIFAGLFELPASLFMCAHVSNASISSLGLSGSPMHGFALLTGKSGVTNTFIAPLELFASPCSCLRTFGVFTWVLSPSDSSACHVALPVDESAVLGLLACTDDFLHMSNCICMYCNTVCVYPHVLHAYAASGLDLVVCRLSLRFDR